MNATSSSRDSDDGGGDDDSSYRGDRDRGTSCDDDDDAANCDGDQVICAGSPRMSAMGQTEKYSKRADIFRSSADSRHPGRPFG